ncbi:MAG TPA: hypothetical protein VK399_00990, partial [Longimicrobiaceae bacterium]|nr:hypothetical protein [Longimicrobiaceae bacterium]
EAVDALGDEALDIYVRRARSTDDAEVHKGLAALIEDLNGRRISVEARLSVALDETLPLLVRLATFVLGPKPIDQRAVPLVDTAVYGDDWYSRTLAARAIWKSADPLALWRSVLSRTDVPADVLHGIVKYFSPQGASGDFATVIATLARDPAIPVDIRRKLMVFAARYGDADAMSTLVDEIGGLPYDLVAATVSIFGYHRSRQLAERAARALHSVHFTAEQRVGLFSSAVLGMTALYQMDWFDGGAIHPAPPHPGASHFRELLEEWSLCHDYELLQTLRIDEDLVRLGSNAAIERLPRRIEIAIAADEIDLQDHDNAHTVSAAIRALRENHRLLEITFLETVVDRCSWNGATEAAQMIAAHASRDALDSLIGIYAAARKRDFRAFILDLLEPLAGRLGLRVRLVDGRLEASA